VLITRDPWVGSAALLVGFCVVAGATGLAVAAGGTRWPPAALGALAAAVLVVAVQTSPTAAVGLGGIGYLFFDGFIVGRHAQLAWPGLSGLWPLAALTGVALTGSLLGWARRRFIPAGDAQSDALTPVRIAAYEVKRVQLR
jgi:hypothetical protein